MQVQEVQQIDTVFDSAKLRGLADSIRANGVPAAPVARDLPALAMAAEAVA